METDTVCLNLYVVYVYGTQAKVESGVKEQEKRKIRHEAFTAIEQIKVLVNADLKYLTTSTNRQKLYS
jgi:hypothetical protein